MLRAYREPGGEAMFGWLRRMFGGGEEPKATPVTAPAAPPAAAPPTPPAPVRIVVPTNVTVAPAGGSDTVPVPPPMLPTPIAPEELPPAGVFGTRVVVAARPVALPAAPAFAAEELTLLLHVAGARRGQGRNRGALAEVLRQVSLAPLPRGPRLVLRMLRRPAQAMVMRALSRLTRAEAGRRRNIGQNVALVAAAAGVAVPPVIKRRLGR